MGHNFQERLKIIITPLKEITQAKSKGLSSTYKYATKQKFGSMLDTVGNQI